MTRGGLRSVLIAGVSWIALCLVPLGPAAAVIPDSDTLLAHFQNVVFKVEAKTPTSKPLYRWAEPIRARLADEHGETYRNHVEDLFHILSRLTGLSISLAERPPYNLDIYFLQESEIRRRFKNSNLNCLGQLKGSKSKATITGAQVFISLQSEFRTRHCIIEEITQILGLTNDTHIIADSIFNDSSKATALSLTDRIMVRTLYDRALRPGMTASEAKPVARKVIERLLAGIDDALANPPAR